MYPIATHNVCMPKPTTKTDLAKNSRFNMRLSDTGDYLLSQLANKQGIPRSAVVELAIRELAKQNGIPIPEKDPDPT